MAGIAFPRRAGFAIPSGKDPLQRNREIFWLHYRAGLSARAIADLPEIGLTAKGVESVIMRVTKELRERLAEPKLGVQGQIQPRPEGFLSA